MVSSFEMSPATLQLYHPSLQRLGLSGPLRSFLAPSSSGIVQDRRVEQCRRPDRTVLPILGERRRSTEHLGVQETEVRGGWVREQQMRSWPALSEREPPVSEGRNIDVVGRDPETSRTNGRDD